MQLVPSSARRLNISTLEDLTSTSYIKWHKFTLHSSYSLSYPPIYLMFESVAIQDLPFSNSLENQEEQPTPGQDFCPLVSPKTACISLLCEKRKHHF
jgi:hypothetical protein